MNYEIPEIPSTSLIPEISVIPICGRQPATREAISYDYKKRHFILLCPYRLTICICKRHFISGSKFINFVSSDLC